MAKSSLTALIAVWAKRGVLAAITAVALRILTRRKQRAIPGRMGMTAMEDVMGRSAAFPASSNVTQLNNVLNTFCWYDDCPTAELVAECFTKVMVNKRFRAVPGKMTWHLVDTKVTDHIGVHEVATEAAALELLEDICNTKELPADRPLWRVEIAKAASGQSVVLIRIHHVIGDGIGQVSEVLPHLATDRKGQPMDFSPPEMPKRSLGLVGNVLWWLDSTRSFFKVLGAAAGPFETDLPMLDPTRRNLKYSGKRSFLFFPVLDLLYIKKVKDAGKCTINDLVYSAWAGTVRRYCIRHGETFGKKAIVKTLLAVVVPRSFPEGHDKEDMLTNNFTFVPVNLDVNTTDLQKRLRSNKANLDIVKKTTIALTSLWIVNNLQPCLPESAQQQTARDLFARHSIVFSNVPGPKEDINLLGKPVIKFFPTFLNVIPQMLAISCGDKLFMNVTADPDVVKDIHELPAMFVEELDFIGRAYGVEGTCAHS